MNFAAPFFLYGLISISIPIIIHLVELRKARKILFTNVAFINEVKNITSNHRHLKQILILLCRIGFLLFLVLLFAQPFLPAKKQTIQNSENVKIFLDNSLSMQNESTVSSSNLLDAAKASIKKLIQNIGINGRFSYLDHSGISNIYTDYSGLKLNETLDQVQLANAQKSLGNVFYDFASQANLPYTALIYSDFQKSAGNAKSFASLDKENQYYFIKVNGGANSNAFVDSVYVEDEFIRANQLNQIRVKVRNSGSKDINNCNVKFYIGAEQVSALSINVPAKQSTTFVLNYRLADTTPQNCRIVLQDYPLDFDNSYYFTLQASPAIKIVSVTEDINSPVQRLFTNEPIFQYNQVTPAQFNYTLLKDANLIILNSLTTLSPAFIENLNLFVKDGGSVALIPSGTPQGQGLTQLLQKFGINGAQSTQAIAAAASQFDLALPDRNNPFFRNIFEKETPNMVMPTAAKVLSWSRASVDILKYRDNSRFLSQFNRGKGKIYLFAAPVQEEYSTFANHALFVPVMYKMAMQSYQQKQDMAYVLGQRNISYPVAQYNNKEVFRLVKDSISYIPEQQIREGNLIFSLPPDIKEAGFYKLNSGNMALANFAFNLPKQESELDFYSANELKELTQDANNVHILDVSDEIAMKNLFAQENIGTQLWKYCLILCLLFALSEILLIRFM